MNMEHEQNVSMPERHYSLLGGGAILLSGLRHASIMRLAVGGYLAYRGMTGHCPLRTTLEQYGVLSGGQDDSAQASNPTFGGPREELWKGQQPSDQVDEAAMESFPASDPPSYSRTSV